MIAPLADSALIDNSGRACLLFAAWYLGERDAIRTALVPVARRMARGKLMNEARALLATIAVDVDDPGLTTTTTSAERSTAVAALS